MDDIDPAEVQEFRDMWRVWVWIKAFGGVLNQDRAALNHIRDRRTEIFSERTHGGEWRHAAAEWTREQERKVR
jgi:hypothetical protein